MNAQKEESSISVDELVRDAKMFLSEGSYKKRDYVLILHNGTKPEELMEAIEKAKLPYFISKVKHYERIPSDQRTPHYIIDATKI